MTKSTGGTGPHSGTTVAGQVELLATLRQAMRDAADADSALPIQRASQTADVEHRMAELAQREKSRVRQLEVELRGEYLRLSSEAVQQHDARLEEAQRMAADEIKRLRARHRKRQQAMEYELFLATRRLKRELVAAKARELQRHRRQLEELTAIEEQRRGVVPEVEEMAQLRRVALDRIIRGAGFEGDGHGDGSGASDSDGAAQPRAAAQMALQRAERSLRELTDCRLSRAVDQYLCWIVGLVGALGFLVWGAVTARSGAAWTWLVGACIAWLALAAVGHLLLGWWAQRLAARKIPALLATLDTAGRLIERARDEEQSLHGETLRRLVAEARAARDQLRSSHFTRLRELDVELELHIAGAEERLAERREHFSGELVATNESLRRQFLPRIDRAKLGLEDQLRRWQEERRREMDRIAAECGEAQRATRDAWTQVWQATAAAAGDSVALAARRLGEWTARLDHDVFWTSEPDQAGLSVPWGSLRVPLESLEPRIPADAALRAPQSELELAAWTHLPTSPALVLEYGDAEGQAAAIEALRAITLRMLCDVPAGQLRLTLIDPLGLGEGFSGFMHLRDYDPRLVGDRIWTEPAKIGQSLCQLSEHVEDVIQHYLRNEHANLFEYNRQASEVPVPLRLLVISGFPENFSEDACRWLAKILASGPRCGVATLMAVDSRCKPPRGVSLDAFSGLIRRLVWRDGAFHAPEPPLADYPLTMIAPPPEPRLSEVVHELGRAAAKAQRVELAFDLVAPAEDQWWRGSSSDELAIPIGRGPSNRLQQLRLGLGTSQHVLVAGKTGSGKSSLLHVMIVNAALHYAPSELQFYLIDFKKGVEFKSYAEQELPHARVIAIESEREFGLSVLERLDRELQRRGELYRQVNAQSVADYRASRPGELLPRILLVADEFQEWFVADDQIASEAALLLDRLVRQGRAFGIHVVLGTQTLAGAYSLARGTLGQMTVRVALQCSAVDAHLILSDENDAARWLNRPGEAIYNDSSGRPEGNSEFQVAWLSGTQRSDLLDRLRMMGRELQPAPEPAVVFEGSAAADIDDNRLLQRTLEAPRPDSIPLAPRGWLGAAIAIKEPPAAVFQRRVGSHLLVVGQHEETARSIVSGCLTGLAGFVPLAEAPTATDAPRDDACVAGATPADECATFELILGSHGDSSGGWREWLDAFRRWHRVHGPDEAGAVVERLARVVADRHQSPRTTWGPGFVVLWDVHQLSELRSREDQFGITSWDESTDSASAKALGAVLADGPTVGVHVIAWADSYHRAKEFFDRAAMRQFGQRVLLRMNALDSTQLIDHPAAAHLGPHRAIFHRESDGVIERFRPYAPPSASWLAAVAERLAARRLVESS